MFTFTARIYRRQILTTKVNPRTVRVKTNVKTNVRHQIIRKKRINKCPSQDVSGKNTKNKCPHNIICPQKCVRHIRHKIWRTFMVVFFVAISCGGYFCTCRTQLTPTYTRTNTSSHIKDKKFRLRTSFILS